MVLAAAMVFYNQVIFKHFITSNAELPKNVCRWLQTTNLLLQCHRTCGLVSTIVFLLGPLAEISLCHTHTWEVIGTYTTYLESINWNVPTKWVYFDLRHSFLVFLVQLESLASHHRFFVSDLGTRLSKLDDEHNMHVFHTLWLLSEGFRMDSNSWPLPLFHQPCYQKLCVNRSPPRSASLEKAPARGSTWNLIQVASNLNPPFGWFV